MSTEVCLQSANGRQLVPCGTGAGRAPTFPQHWHAHPLVRPIPVTPPTEGRR